MSSTPDLELLLLIRHFELQLLEMFGRGELSGTTHTCLGQEYVPVVLEPLLRDGDFVFSNHRGHGHYLARYDDPEGLLAEILGRQGALCRGVGGSQHLFRDGFLSTGVQGESLPVAVGVALHFRRAAAGRVVVAYIGDGTWGEGAVYEALNMAQLWQVPLVVVVENNEIAQSTPRRNQMAGTISGRAAAFGIAFKHIDGCDLSRIRSDLKPLFDGIRSNAAPLVLEFATHRLGPHSKGDDSRPASQIQEAQQNDWYSKYRKASPTTFARTDEAARARIESVASEVLARPLSTWVPS